MTPRFAAEYTDSLLAKDSFEGLADLSTAICSSPCFSAELADYALPPFAFVFVEGLLWLSQSLRSGVCTYYEATPPDRIRLMSVALRGEALLAVAAEFDRGAREWQGATCASETDHWISDNEEMLYARLRSILRRNRARLLGLT